MVLLMVLLHCVQGTTCVFSKKVEYLHNLVYQALETIFNKRSQAKQAASAAGAAAAVGKVSRARVLRLQQRCGGVALLQALLVGFSWDLTVWQGSIPIHTRTCRRSCSRLLPLVLITAAAAAALVVCVSGWDQHCYCWGAPHGQPRGLLRAAESAGSGAGSIT